MEQSNGACRGMVCGITSMMGFNAIASCRDNAGSRVVNMVKDIFRVERSRLIEEMSVNANETTMDPALSLQDFYASVLRDPSAFIEQVLQDHWSRDPAQKRKHQKVHGSRLTRCIAANWNAVPDLVKDVFRQIAARNLRRYDNEVQN
jgi:hypothetical protein